MLPTYSALFEEKQKFIQSISNQEVDDKLDRNLQMHNYFKLILLSNERDELVMGKMHSL